jgi:hypothetical protein
MTVLKKPKSAADKAQELDERRQAQIARQIDSINRLLEADGTGPIKPYEHELMTLNEQLALADVRREHLEGVLRKIRQSCRDRLNGGLTGSSRRDPIENYLEWIKEVIPDEGPGYVAEGRNTSNVQIHDLPAQDDI